MFLTLRRAVEAFNADKVPRLAAALSYYLVFSIAPLIIVLITLIDHLISLHPGATSEHAVRQQIIDKLTNSVGVSGARAVNSFIQATSSQKRTGTIANIMSWALVILGRQRFIRCLARCPQYHLRSPCGPARVYARHPRPPDLTADDCRRSGTFGVCNACASSSAFACRGTPYFAFVGWSRSWSIKPWGVDRLVCDAHSPVWNSLPNFTGRQLNVEKHHKRSNLNGNLVFGR